MKMLTLHVSPLSRNSKMYSLWTETGLQIKINAHSSPCTQLHHRAVPISHLAAASNQHVPHHPVTPHQGRQLAMWASGLHSSAVALTAGAGGRRVASLLHLFIHHCPADTVPCS